MTHELTSRPKIRPARFEVPSLDNLLPASHLTRLSIHEVTTFKWSLDEDVCGYRDAGVGAIGIWRQKLADFGEERGIDFVRESGLHVSSLSWIGGFTGQNQHSFRDSIVEAAETIELAGALGAEAVTLISGARCGHTRNHARRLLVDAIQELGDVAARVGVLLAVQPMHAQFSSDWSFLDTLDETLDILDRSRHPAARIHFDAFQLCREPRLLDRVQEIAGRTAVVQLSDWDGRTCSQMARQLPGDGILPLAEIAEAFATSGYDGYFEIAVWSERVWQDDYQFVLSDCVKRYRKLFVNPENAATRSSS